jgi:hypothetical protein
MGFPSRFILAALVVLGAAGCGGDGTATKLLAAEKRPNTPSNSMRRTLVEPNSRAMRRWLMRPWMRRATLSAGSKLRP